MAFLLRSSSITPMWNKALFHYKFVKRKLECQKWIFRHKSGGSGALEQALHPSNSGALSLGRYPHLKVGSELNGFIVKEVESVPEFQLTAIKLVHEKTGGEFLHIDRDDSNNAFSVLFRTTPKDSTGLPHILEHTTLCGSSKFPCRDPFFKMLNRSLATFMNAITAPDYTMYPFSTQNPKDFENLMSVYLDAVFRPALKELDFHQEGWRLEHENPQDPESPIVFKGVVYNEMKGVFSDNQNIFEYALQRTIMPSHTYGVCSGGDPAEIPTLAHEDLVRFHANFYSPWNAKYYSYGNFPLENHLKYLNDQYLRNHEGKAENPISTAVPPEKRWSEPVRKHVRCREDPLAADKSKQSSIAVSVLCCDITDVDECFLLKVLSNLLVSGPNSSFYKTLVEPNIGAGFSPVTGFESSTRDTIFSVGLQGVSEKEFDNIVRIYENTVDEVIEKGFDEKNVEAVMHSIELNLKHQTSDFGLGLAFALAPVWNHEGDVLAFMKIENQMEKLRQKMREDPRYLQKAVKKYFKDNKHKLILTMSPASDYSETEKKREQDMLKNKVASLTEKDKKLIYEKGLKLLEEQKKDDKSCLPTLKMTDLRKEVEPTPVKETDVRGLKLYEISQPTNGVTYFRGLLGLDPLSDHLRPLLPVFSLVATKMGTLSRTHKEFDQLATLKTGGLDVSLHFKTDPDDANSLEQTLAVSSYCLDKNLYAMFDLWLETFNEMDLRDVELLETLLNGHAASLVNGLTHAGHRYAVLSAASLVSPTHAIKERTSGLAYVDHVKKLASSDHSQTLTQLAEIRDQIMNRSRLRSAVNFAENSRDAVLKAFEKFATGARGEVQPYLPPSPLPVSRPEPAGLFYVLPAAVSYTAKVVPGVPYAHEDHAALSVAARLLTTKHLHPTIREKGGAYGGGLNACPSGTLNFYSYRDPDPAASLAVYDEAGSWFFRRDFTSEDVDEAKLSIFQSVDAPVPPGARGTRWFLSGLSDEIVARHRLRLMKVTKEDVARVAEKYLGENARDAGRAVIGPANESLASDSRYKFTVIDQH